MITTKALFFYVIYTVSAAIFFLYFLFPSETAEQYAALRLKRINPDFTLAMDRIKPVAPPGLRASGVRLFHLKDPANAPLFQAENLTVSPNLKSLFQGRLAFSLRGSAYAGSIDGHAEISRKSQNRSMDLDVALSQIQIKNITLLRRLIDRDISGVLNGKITFDGADLSGTGNAKIVISECTVELLVPLTDLNQLTFITVEADIDFKNQQFQVNQCLFKGQQMDGKLSGTLTLKDPPGESLLNLTGMVKPHHFFLAELKKSLPANLFPRTRPGSGGFPVRITGTLEKPGFSLQ